MQISPDEFITAALGWQGSPFLIGGRTKHGVDCASFMLETARQLGLIEHGWIPPTYGDRQLQDPDFLAAHLERFCDRVDGPPQVGDVILLDFRGLVCHCGLKVADDRLLHVTRRHGCSLVSLTEPFLRRLSAVFRPRFYTT